MRHVPRGIVLSERWRKRWRGKKHYATQKREKRKLYIIVSNLTKSAKRTPEERKKKKNRGACDGL